MLSDKGYSHIREGKPQPKLRRPNPNATTAIRPVTLSPLSSRRAKNPVASPSATRWTCSWTQSKTTT